MRVATRCGSIGAAKGVALSRKPPGDACTAAVAPRELVCEQALPHGAERGEVFDALGAALLDAFDFVDLVADEFEEAGHHLRSAGSSAGRAWRRRRRRLELGALVGVVIIRRKARCESRPWESQAVW